jgi:hypothetical protein
MIPDNHHSRNLQKITRTEAMTVMIIPTTRSEVLIIDLNKVIVPTMVEPTTPILTTTTTSHLSADAAALAMI